MTTRYITLAYEGEKDVTELEQLGLRIASDADWRLEDGQSIWFHQVHDTEAVAP
jgi:hypothetical protein